MKVVVDARMITHGGIGTYLQQLLMKLEHSSYECFPLLPEQMASSIYSVREQFELPFKIPSCDLFWAPHFNIPILPICAKQRIVTIHDLFHLDHLAQFSFSKRLYAKLMMAQAVRRADWMITVSEFSKKRLLTYFPEAKEKVEVIHSGCDHLSPLERKPVEGLSLPFFLFVGNLKPHKNLPIILEALQNWEGFDLVVAGKMEGFIHGVDRKALEKKYPSLKGRIHFLGKISDAELSWLYTHAEALIFPSLYEGWGLPPLEAMHLGCPVIASTAASIPEACGEAASYFDPHNVGELCEKIAELPKIRNRLIESGKKRATGFTWERTARQHFQLFDRLGSSRP